MGSGRAPWAAGEYSIAENLKTEKEKETPKHMLPTLKKPPPHLQEGPNLFTDLNIFLRPFCTFSAHEKMLPSHK